MAGLAEIELPVIRNHRHAGDEVECHLSLRHDEIYLSKIFRRTEKVRYVRTHELCEFKQYAEDLPLL